MRQGQRAGGFGGGGYGGGGFGGGGFGGGGLGNPFAGTPPKDVIALVAVVFVTFAFQFFAGLRLIPALLSLGPEVWRSLFVWQVATNPFVGRGGPSLWFLLELLIVFWFAKDVFWHLGRRRFWTLLVAAGAAAGIAAVLVDVLASLAGSAFPGPFSIMVGQRTLLAIVIAAFASLYADATILLFFVLPVRARWFLWIEILFAFMAYLGSKDLPGFVGICVAVGFTYAWLQPGGIPRFLKTRRKRLEARILEQRLKRMRRRRRFDVVDGGDRRVN